MLDFRRSFVCLVTAAGLLALAGCTGLGTSIGSGAKGSDFVQTVIIQTLDSQDVLQLNAGHCLVVQAVAISQQGGGNGVSSIQGATWKTANSPTGGPSSAGNIALFEADCLRPYIGDVQQTIGIKSLGTQCSVCAVDLRHTDTTCSSGLPFGDGTANVVATVKGVVGFNTVKVFFR